MTTALREVAVWLPGAIGAVTGVVGALGDLGGLLLPNLAALRGRAGRPRGEHAAARDPRVDRARRAAPGPIEPMTRACGLADEA
jgi:hypothetical protein